MRKPNPELERRAKLLQQYLNECWGLSHENPQWTIFAFAYVGGVTYGCVHPEYDWADQVYEEDANHNLTFKGPHEGKNCMSRYLFLSHNERDRFDSDRLCHYWAKTEGIDFNRRYHYEISMAEKMGHNIHAVLPYIGDPTFVSLRCYHPETVVYYLHFDDGDLTVTKSHIWANEDPSNPRHVFYDVPLFERVLEILG